MDKTFEELFSLLPCCKCILLPKCKASFNLSHEKTISHIFSQLTSIKKPIEEKVIVIDFSVFISELIRPCGILKNFITHYYEYNYENERVNFIKDIIRLYYLLNYSEKMKEILTDELLNAVFNRYKYKIHQYH